MIIMKAFTERIAKITSIDYKMRISRQINSNLLKILMNKCQKMKDFPKLKI